MRASPGPGAIVVTGVAALLTSACTTLGPGYRAPDSVALAVPQAYANAEPGAPSQAELQRWWTRFGDPHLDSLISRSLSGNLDLEVARNRLRQSRESVIQARSDRLPSVGATGQVNQSFDSDGNDQRSYSLGADASWEADLFGGLAQSVEAAGAAAESSAYDLAAVRVAIIAEVATNYVQARLAQQRMVLGEQNLAYADENLEIAGWRLQAGLVSSLDVEQARTARAQIAASLPNFERNLAAAVYRLGVLTGQAPASLEAEFATARPVPVAPARVAAGLPADTLRQRPDVRSAERALAAETVRIGVAEAQLYPRFRIGGNLGTSALSLGGLVDLITGNLFGALSQTIFDGGRLRSQVRTQQAAAEIAFANYRTTVLTSLEDVENALVAVRTAELREEQYVLALEAAQNQALLARTSYRAGLSDFQVLLNAEQALTSASEGLLTAQGDRTLAVIQLYRALGGGWNPAAPSA